MLPKHQVSHERKSPVRTNNDENMQKYASHQAGKTQEEIFWNIEEEIYREQSIFNKIQASRVSPCLYRLNESEERQLQRKP